MKKTKLFLLFLTCGLFFITANSFSEEPEIKREQITKSPIISVDSETLAKGNTIVDLSNEAGITTQSRRINGESSGRYSNVFLNGSYSTFFMDNIAVNYGINWDRVSNSYNNEINNYTDTDGSLLVGLTYANIYEDNFAYYGKVNINLGYDRYKDIEYTYNAGGLEILGDNIDIGNLFGYNLGVGAFTQPFNNKNLIVDAFLDYTRNKTTYDDRDYIDSEVCFDLSTKVSLGCDEYFCKMDERDIGIQNFRHRFSQGTISFPEQNTLMFGVGTNSYISSHTTKNNTREAELDLSANYYPWDNIKLGASFCYEAWRSKNSETAYINAGSWTGFNILGGSQLASEGTLNNLSGNVDIGLALDRNKNVSSGNAEASISSDLVFNAKLYVQYDYPVAEGVDLSVKAGIENNTYSSLQSDYKYNYLGLYTSVGLTTYITRNF